MTFLCIASVGGNGDLQVYLPLPIKLVFHRYPPSGVSAQQHHARK